MLENVFSILAVVISIFLVWLLVEKQKKHREDIDTLIDEMKNNLGEAANELNALTGKDSIENSLTSLENNMKEFSDHLYNIQKISPPSHRLERRSHHVKCKTKFTDY